MTTDGDEEVQLVADEIARYLTAEPLAADSVEGIGRWWLTPRIGERRPSVIREALERLERKGIVKRRELPGSSIIWGAASAPTKH
jgi:hypothetical protein